jgi:hypothetical protein
LACIARKNFDKEKEIWLVFPKKAWGKSRILYNDAVEEAFCFELIDSQVKALDEENSAQLFSPRNSKSGYSQAKRTIKMASKENLLHPQWRKLPKKVL